MVPEGTDVDGWTCLRQYPFSHDAPEVSPSPSPSVSPSVSPRPSASPCSCPSPSPNLNPNPTQDKMDEDEMYLDSAEVIEGYP